MKIKKIFLASIITLLLLCLTVLPISAMQIFIQISNGKTISLDVEPTDRIEDLREKINDAENISIDKQMLSYNSTTLEDGNTLQDYSIQKDSILTLSLISDIPDDEAGIFGANVNLGGDISMKYYVEKGENIDIDLLTLKTTFLSTEQFLMAEENPIIYEDRVLYVFILEGINPQCMGELIDAELYLEEEPLECENATMLDYSVKENLTSIYPSATSDTKQLIIDTLEYGAAAQTVTGYKTDALVTSGVEFISEGIAEKSPTSSSYVYTGATDEIYIEEISINFSYANQIKVTYQNGESIVETSDIIAPYDFSKKQTFSVEGGFTLQYSTNNYCYDVLNDDADGIDDYSEEIEAFASALYNYGLSAHIVKGNHEGGEGTQTCEHGKVCSICAQYYDEKLEHNYTYVADDVADTITESCDRGCGHLTTHFLVVPQNAVYNGNLQNASSRYEGDAFVTPIRVTFASTCTNPNAGDNLVYMYIGDLNNTECIVSATYTIAKATPTVSAPTENALIYNGQAQELISSGSTTGGTMMYKVGEDGTWSAEIPTAKDAGTYTVYYMVDGGNNYNNVVNEDTLTVTIEQWEIALEWSAPENLIYDRNAKLATALPIGIIDGDECEITVSCTSGNNINVGSFYCIANTISNTNYKLPENILSPEYIITPKSVTVTATAQTKTYGDADPELSFTFDGILSSDSDTEFLGTLSRNVGEDVGTYTINIGDLQINSNNYTIEFVSGELTITPLQITEATITLDDSDIIYDRSEKTPAPTVTVGGETLIVDEDYTLSYENNVFVTTETNKAHITVTFIGNYTGELEVDFDIIQDPDTEDFDGEWVEFF